MDADVIDDAGQPVRGEVGELVVRQPWVGMTRGFWRDPERYLETYWSRIPGVWVHGDWAEIDDDGQWFIRGRSDDTLKVAGKRVGPAEVESAATAHRAVQEAAAIGVPHEIKGEAIVVFAVPKPGVEVTDALAEEVRQTIAAQLGAALRPERVHLGARPAEDAQRQDHAPGDPRRLPRTPRRGRHRAGEPGGGRGDRDTCQSRQDGLNI